MLFRSEERNYWDRFWREILGRSLLVRDAAVATFDVKKGEACGRFPLARDGQEELTFADLTALAGGPGIDVAAAVQGSANANELTKLIESKSLADVLASLKASPPASAGSDACTTSALRLAELGPGTGLALRCSVTLRVDQLSLPAGLTVSDGAWRDASRATALQGHIPLVTVENFGSRGVITKNSKMGEFSLTSSGQTPGEPAKITFSAGIIPGLSAVEVDLGRAWPALRLAALLKPLPGGDSLAKDQDGYYWGSMPIPGSTDVIVFVGVKVDWVGSSTTSASLPIDLGAWLKESRN